jgi:hypothetical protein
VTDPVRTNTDCTNIQLHTRLAGGLPFREDFQYGASAGFGGAALAAVTAPPGIGEEQLAKALDLMLEEDTLSQVGARPDVCSKDIP